MTGNRSVGSVDVLGVLAEDHGEIEQLLTRLRSSDRDELSGVLTAILVRHAIAEEEYVYPVVRDQVAGGERIADRGMSQHAQLEETMQRLEATANGSAERHRLLAALAEEARRHISHDRSVVFPGLRRSCTRTDLGWLGEQVAGLRHAGRDLARLRGIRTLESTGLIEEVRNALTARSGHNPG